MDSADSAEHSTSWGSGFGRTARENAEIIQAMGKERLFRLMHAVMTVRHIESDKLPSPVEPGLFVGSVGAAHNKAELQQCQVSHVICVANFIPPPYPNDFKYTQVEILDSPNVDIVSRFAECFDAINEAKQQGMAAMVHCFAGRSRSATVVVAYLMKEHGISLDEALTIVRRTRPEACPNSGFMGQLREYEKMLAGERMQGSDTD